MSRRSHSDGWILVGTIVLVFLLLFLVWPLFCIFFEGLVSRDAYIVFFRRAYYYRGFLNSLWLSSASSLGSILLGVPLALLVARYEIPMKGLIRTVSILSLLSPPFIGAYAWVLLFGRSSSLAKVLHLNGGVITGANRVLLVFILHHFAYVYLLVSSALERVDPCLEESAETMGMSPRRRLTTITLPLVMPSILAGAMLVFLTTLSDFGTPMLVGDGIRTLPILVYNEFINEIGGNPKMASALSLIMVCVALSAMALIRCALAKRNYASYGVRRPVLKPLSGRLRWLGTGFSFWIIAVLLLPQLVILFTSFMHQEGPVFSGEIGLDNYRWLWRRMATPFINTISFSTIASVIILLSGMVTAFLLVRRRGWIGQLVDRLLTLAHIVPGTVLAIGLLLCWGRPPLSLTGTAAILVIAYIVRRISFTVRAAEAGLRQISPAIEESSLALGASPLRTFCYVTVPLLLPAALAGATVSWVSILGELSSTALLYTGSTSTISIQIYNQVLAEHFGRAAALGVVTVLLTLLSLFVLSRWRNKDQNFLALQ